MRKSSTTSGDELRACIASGDGLRRVLDDREGARHTVISVQEGFAFFAWSALARLICGFDRAELRTELDTALDTAIRHRDNVHTGPLGSLAGALAFEEGDFTTAELEFRLAEQRMIGMSDRGWMEWTEAMRARTLVRLGRLDDAARLIAARPDAAPAETSDQESWEQILVSRVRLGIRDTAAETSELRAPELDTISGATALLTSREREIAALAAAGLSNREIAVELWLSVRTVESHLYLAMRKLGVTSRTDLG